MGRGGAGARSKGARVRALGNLRARSRAASQAVAARLKPKKPAGSTNYDKQFKSAWRRTQERARLAEIRNSKKAAELKSQANNAARAEAERAKIREERAKRTYGRN